MNNSDGFWSWYEKFALRGFAGLGVFAFFLWGMVAVITLIGIYF